MIPYFYNKITIAYGLALSASAFAFAFFLGFYVRSAYANKSILPDPQIDLVSVIRLSIFVIVSGAVALLLLRRMQKRLGVTRKHLGVILISGIASAGALHIVSY